ncbi:hypothetical protein B0T22DRAFT_439417 [Podospora appendiculata]|uniref:Uncharacterized protein n=1 Tax=Podospora appendiculata TaxID=314037 RepID=A0AAE0X845_9PEZI|nr:hypothetical protein B0T22DRAFT_439417 [Podospora appendiculata]
MSSPTTTTSQQPQMTQQQQQQEQQTPPSPKTLVAAITTDLFKDLTSPASPTSPHCAVDAARAMSTTDDWVPQMNRRQSWSQQEYRHGLQMSRVVGDEKKQTGGFTERS